MGSLTYRVEEVVESQEERKEREGAERAVQRERDIRSAQRYGPAPSRIKLDRKTIVIKSDEAREAERQRLRELQRAEDYKSGSGFNPRRAGWG